MPDTITKTDAIKVIDKVLKQYWGNIERISPEEKAALLGYLKNFTDEVKYQIKQL